MSNPNRPNDQSSTLPPYGESEDERRRKRIEAVRDRLGQGALLSDDERVAVLRLDFIEFPKAITAHSGHLASRKLASLETALQLFRAASAEVLTLLDQFHDLSGTKEFNYAIGQKQHEALEILIRKELFCFSDLAHSVQDHARRLRDAWGGEKPYAERLGVHFKSDGQHDFVMKLRTALHHLQMFEADWSLNWSESKERSSHYRFQKADLLADFKDWGPGKAYLEAAQDELDVRSLVTDYLARCESFYGWFVPWAYANLPPAVAEYRNLRLAHKQDLVRMSWRFLLKELTKRNVDPMPYLHWYLLPEDEAQAKAMPPHSRELAEFLIFKLDEDGACNEELRELVYKLFGVTAA